MTVQLDLSDIWSPCHLHLLPTDYLHYFYEQSTICLFCQHLPSISHQHTTKPTINRLAAFL
jgi:hypothetical protein